MLPKKQAKWVAASTLSLLISCGVGVVATEQRAYATDASAGTPAGVGPSAIGIKWTSSLPITYEDPSIGTFGGTELRAGATLGGRLYVANDYWQDAQMGNANLPGPQVYRLDAANGEWQVEYELPRTADKWGLREFQAFSNLQKVVFSKDKDGRVLKPAAELLVAGVFSHGTGIDVFLRSPSGRWSRDPIPPQSYLPKGAQIRGFATHIDTVTGTQMIFAGSGDVIFSGTYNAQAQLIDWNAAPDWLGPTPGKNNIQSHGGRVTSLAECGGKLYAAGNGIYQRQDGAQPAWTMVFTLPRRQEGGNARGFSGLTCATGPSQQPALFAGFQGAGAGVARIDLDPSGAEGVVELDATKFLTEQLHTKVRTAIVAYNDMTLYPSPDTKCPKLLMGFSAQTPEAAETFATTHKYTGAAFLVRDCESNYSVEWVRDPAIKPAPELVGVRAIVLSPFSQDPPGTIYVGGFDAGNAPARGVHNTAWLYKGVPPLH